MLVVNMYTYPSSDNSTNEIVELNETGEVIRRLYATDSKVSTHDRDAILYCIDFKSFLSYTDIWCDLARIDTRGLPVVVIGLNYNDAADADAIIRSLQHGNQLGVVGVYHLNALSGTELSRIFTATIPYVKRNQLWQKCIKSVDLATQEKFNASFESLRTSCVSGEPKLHHFLMKVSRDVQSQSKPSVWDGIKTFVANFIVGTVVSGLLMIACSALWLGTASVVFAHLPAIIILAAMIGLTGGVCQTYRLFHPAYDTSQKMKKFLRNLTPVIASLEEKTRLSVEKEVNDLTSTDRIDKAMKFGIT